MFDANQAKGKAVAKKDTATNSSALAIIKKQNWVEHFTHLAVGSNPNGENIAFGGGMRRSDEVCIFLDMALDNSGSMDQKCGGSGTTRLEVALACIQKIIGDEKLRLHSPDSFSLRTFNGDVNSRFCTFPERFDYKRMLRDIKKDPGNTNNTRMWDAMDETLTVMLDHPDKTRAKREVVRFMLVLTDGEDNASKDTAATIGQKLVAASRKLSNLNVIVIAAGLGTTALQHFQTLTQICHGKVNVHIIRTTTAMDVDIQAAFEKAMEHIRALVFRDASGNVQVVTLATRDAKVAQKADQEAERALQGFKDKHVIKAAPGSTVSKEMRALFAAMGGVKLLQ